MNAILSELEAAQLRAKLVGSAPRFREAISRLPEIARADATVLITGETGTGKELAARAIHYLSQRADHPFVPVNCGALPDSLLESELFGHERGAFTDARTRRIGLIAQAERGTLFLDEVDSLSPRAQISLLRVLQDHTFRMVGGTQEQRVNVRFVAATNRPLNERVQSGDFRADLYYRLAVLPVNMPPLRERRDDVPLLTEHMMYKHRPAGREPLRFSAAALIALEAYSWPGNVRELENAVIRAIHLARGGVIEPADLGLGSAQLGRTPPVDAGSTEESGPLAALLSDGPLETFQEQKQRTIAAFERAYLTRVLAEHNGNVTRAANTAGKERREFGRLLKKHHLDPRRFSSAR